MKPFVQIVTETFLAITIMVCIAVVERVQVKLLGKNALLLRIPITFFTETAHLALFAAWTIQCVVAAYRLVSGRHAILGAASAIERLLNKLASVC